MKYMLAYLQQSQSEYVILFPGFLLRVTSGGLEAETDVQLLNHLGEHKKLRYSCMNLWGRQGEWSMRCY